MGLTPNAGYVLRRPDDVDAMLQRIPLAGFGSRGSLTVLFPALGTSAQLRWERRLTYWLNACGCQMGALCAVSAIVWRIIIVWQGPGLTWGAAVVGFGWVVGAAVIGKVAGLAVARALLILDLKRLRRQMATVSRIPSENPS